MTAEIFEFKRRRSAGREHDDSACLEAALAAIRAGRSAHLVRAVSDLGDRHRFFSIYYQEIAATICDRGDGDSLYALLKLGLPMKSELMEWICRSGHIDLLKVAEECLGDPARVPGQITPRTTRTGVD